jgi:hypothetical protein
MCMCGLKYIWSFITVLFIYPVKDVMLEKQIQSLIAISISVTKIINWSLQWIVQPIRLKSILNSAANHCNKDT